ncbi:hypothetical protein KY330_01475 [Candidatus Woesearchaeota archaeon]|nr:hypothetical protein [Candidatus Woesearchaeota archaeon]
MEYRLLNTKFEDPVILVRNFSENILLDCGRLLTPFTLPWINKVLVTHTHIDHFIGLDDIVRIQLNEGKTIDVYGPEHITKHVHNKLNSYSWNLASKDALNLHVHELSEGERHTTSFQISGDLEGSFSSTYTEDAIYENDNFKIKHIQLNHLIPSIGYSIENNGYFKVDVEKLKATGIEQGPWVTDLLNYANSGSPDTSEVDGKKLRLEDFKHLLIPKKGTKLVYLVDFRPNGNYDSIVKFAKNADYLICESHFTQEDIELAKKHMHMTAKEVALLAKDAEVEQLELVHFSRRYFKQEHLLIEEARKYFENTQ